MNAARAISKTQGSAIASADAVAATAAATAGSAGMVADAGIATRLVQKQSGTETIADQRGWRMRPLGGSHWDWSLPVE